MKVYTSTITNIYLFHKHLIYDLVSGVTVPYKLSNKFMPYDTQQMKNLNNSRSEEEAQSNADCMPLVEIYEN